MRARRRVRVRGGKNKERPGGYPEQVRRWTPRRQTEARRGYQQVRKGVPVQCVLVFRHNDGRAQVAWRARVTLWGEEEPYVGFANVVRHVRFDKARGEEKWSARPLRHVLVELLHGICGNDKVRELVRGDGRRACNKLRQGRHAGGAPIEQTRVVDFGHVGRVHHVKRIGIREARMEHLATTVCAIAGCAKCLKQTGEVGLQAPLVVIVENAHAHRSLP